MKNFLRKFVISVSILLLAVINLNAQSLEETLSHLSSDAASAYVEPIISAYGSNMNSGWVSGVPSASLLGFHLQLRIIAVGSFLKDANRTFSVDGAFRYTAVQADEILQASGFAPSDPQYDNLKSEILSRAWLVKIGGPTITGSGSDNVYVEYPGTVIQGDTIGNFITTLTGVNGFLDGLSIFPQPALQLDVGNVAGTQLSFRYFPGVDVKDIGKISLWGIGVLHNPGFWFKTPLPVNIGLGFFYQRLDVGNIFVNKSTQFGIYLSKPMGLIITFEPYVGLTYETSTTSVTYTYNFDTPVGPQSAAVAFDMDGVNTVGLTIGASLNLPVVSLNVDYKIANIKTLTVGLSLGM